MKVNCIICLETFTDDSETVALDVCGHVFDLECISQSLRMSEKCPLCKRSTLGIRPAWYRVYFSRTHESDREEKAIKDAQISRAETEVALAQMTSLLEEHDALAIELTATRIKKDKKINTLTNQLESVKLIIREENEKMNLKLIAKQKSIDLLSKNLETSNKKIKSLKDQLAAIKQNMSSNHNGPLNSGSRWNNKEPYFKNKSHELTQENRSLKDKVQQLEKELVDLKASTHAASIQAPVESAHVHVGDLYKQAAESIEKDFKLLEDVKKLGKVHKVPFINFLQLQKNCALSELKTLQAQETLDQSSDLNESNSTGMQDLLKEVSEQAEKCDLK